MCPRKMFSLLPISLLILISGIAAWALHPTLALAQCGDNPPESSCIRCHQESHPVIGEGEWHEIHADKDCCWSCHGGNTQTDDKDLAHEGMHPDPLENNHATCYTCHPYDYETRAQRFAVILGVTPEIHAPTPHPTSVAPPDENLALVILPDSGSNTADKSIPYPEFICLALGLGILILIGRRFLLHANHPKLT